MPGLDDVLSAHLAHLRLLGRSERTVYDRERAVIRLAAWLDRYAEKRLTAWKGGVPRPGIREAGRAGALLPATAADLAAWRASLTVGDQAVVVYCAHVTGFYDFAV